MTKEDALAIINKIIDPIDKIDENTRIDSCDDFDSLSLLSIFTELKKQGYTGSIGKFITCTTVGELINLAVNG